MNLYIRNYLNGSPHLWWARFGEDLTGIDGTIESLLKHVEERREKLDAAGASLHTDQDTGLSYLNFKDEKSMCWFLLKWS
jgi:hypothetical protein